MKVIEVIQGSESWHEVRRQYPRTASKAPSVMGASKYLSRSDLIRQEHTGIEQEVDEFKQELFDKGHATEASARSIVEEAIGQELYPVTGISDDEYLLASFDGMTMCSTIGYEHKLWSEDLANQVRNKELDPHYYWQLEQQILVGGLEKVIFVCSDGTRDHFAMMEYHAVPGRADKLLSAWKQFDTDLANYQHIEVAAAPVAAPIADLPALTIELVGRVTATNLADWQAIVTARIQSINTNLQTDQDFADAEKTIKFLGDGEKKLELVKEQALSQTASIDELFRAIDNIKKEMSVKRLELNRTVEKRKVDIRAEIESRGKKAYADHLTSLYNRLTISCHSSMPVADFAGKMKGKKTVASLNDAVDTELARVIPEANAVADRVEANQKTLAEVDPQYAGLFSDKLAIVTKAPDDLAALIKVRIAEHKERQEAAAKAKQEAEDKAAEKARLEAEAKAAQPKPETLVLSGTLVSVSTAQEPRPATIVSNVTQPNIAASTDSGTSAMLAIINQEIASMTNQQLQQVLDSVRSIRARRAA